MKLQFPEELSMSEQANIEKGEAIVEWIHSARGQIFSELHKIIIGQNEVLEQMVIGLLSGGH